MKTLLTCATALVIGLAANSLAWADGSGSHGHSGHSGHSSHGNTNSHNSHSSHGSTKSHSQSNGSHTHSDHHHTNSSSKSSKYTNYHMTHGTKFSKGYFYTGKYHGHWNYCSYSKSFGCYVYSCPSTHCWYYWCAPDCCYYPVSYVPYNCCCWGTAVAYSSAPCPPAGMSVPEPSDEVGPTE